jgi:hypothetical protein
MTTTTNDVKLGAILADLQSFEKTLKAGGLSPDDKAKFSKTVAELDALLTPDTATVEVPRLVKKPGETKRVNTREELDAALADGWALRLPDAPEGDEPSLASNLTAELEAHDGKKGICAVNADTAKGMIADAETVAALDALEAEENANEPQPRVSVLKAIDKRRAELAE